MDYKEKYEQALERASKLRVQNPFDTVGQMVEHIFPELQESEDERIRKGIIRNLQYLMDRSEGFVKEDLQERIAWLEKQGQEPKKVSIWKHWKNGIAGNGEGAQIYLTKVGNTYNLSSCLGFECDYIELSELDNLMLEKQGEQKPTENAKKLDANKVIKWLNDQACLGWLEDVEVEKVVEQFKKDFGL